MNKKSGTAASILYLIGNICTKALAFLTIPIFTRLLTLEEYGIVNTYNSWAHIAAVVVELSLFNSFRVAFVEKKENFDEYCASVVRLGLLLCLGSMAVAAVAIFLFPQLQEYTWMIYCCLFQSYGMFCISSMSAKYMMQYHYKKRAFYMIAPNFLCVGLSILLMYLLPGDRVFARIIGYVAVYVAIAAVTLLTFRRQRTVTAHWKYALKYSLPLVVHGLSLVVLSSSDRIMITSLVGADASGIYSLIHNVGLIAVAVSTALEGVWIPWFSKTLKRQEIGLINNKAKYIIENISVVVICVMLVAPEAVKIMADERYWTGIPMLMPIILASYVMFLYDLAVNVEYQCHATKQIAVNTVFAAVLNIVLNALLIPVFGATAAAYTTLVSYAVSMVIHYCVARRCCKGIFPIKKYLVYMLAVCVSGVLCNLILDLPAVRWAVAVILACGYCYVMIAKRRLISLQLKIED